MADSEPSLRHRRRVSSSTSGCMPGRGASLAATSPDERHHDPARIRAAAAPRAAGMAAAPGPAAADRDARPRRLLAAGAARGDAERHPRLALVLRRAPGDLRDRRPGPDVRRVAHGLL